MASTGERAGLRVVVDANPLFPLSANLGPTGVGRWTAGAVGALARQAPDWKIDLIAFHLTRATIDVSWMGPNVSFKLVRFSNRVHRRLMVARLVPSLERFVGPCDAMLGPAFVTWPAREAAEIPVVHDLTFVNHPEYVSRRNLWYLRLIMPRVLKRAAMVATVSDAVGHEIAHRFRVSSERLAVVPNGCDLDHFDRPGPKPPGLPSDYFLFVGTLEPRKNLEGVLHALEILKRERSEVPQLVVVGGVGWRHDALSEKLAARVRDGSAIALGYVSDDQLPAIYSSARALVFPSFYEGFGLPPLEAMAAGCPVISSQAGGLAEVVSDDALIVEPENPASIAEAMRRVLDDEGLRKDLIRRGRDRARDFSWDRAGAQLKSTIEEAVRLTRFR
jgi:glycosyltransferase involved in cell wall biosynthesis